MGEHQEPPVLPGGCRIALWRSAPVRSYPRREEVNAGAQFIQTQPIFDYEGFVDWLEALDKRNLLDKVYILAGLIPLKSAQAAHFMADDVPGLWYRLKLSSAWTRQATKKGRGRRRCHRPGDD